MGETDNRLKYSHLLYYFSMPFGEFKHFKDCVSKNKSKDDPSAYCGYIKNQIEGGKKKEEVMDFPEHELFHLEETVKREEGEVCPHGYGDYGSLCPICDKEYVKQLEKRMGHGEEADRQTRLPKGVQHTIKRMGGPEEWTPESEIEKATGEFLNTLKATIDEVTLMAKDTGYMGVSDKVSPTPPVYSFPVSGELVDTVVHNVKGFDVQTNFFNQTMAELKDIVKDADKFFVDAGWNSKETVKEYAKHMKKNGKDWD